MYGSTNYSWFRVFRDIRKLIFRAVLIAILGPVLGWAAWSFGSKGEQPPQTALEKWKERTATEANAETADKNPASILP